tara:strand:- start:240 stop:1097 length:858 start_codon:yes stop_codon:yes gene_type:complete
MNGTPLVSVIVNCFNSEKTILRAINSILSQTFTYLEIIVWDNDSVDSTRDIVSSIDDIRVRLFKSNKTVSLGIARNFAVNEATGKFMAFCDSDDWWEPFKLKDQLQFLDGSRYSFVCSDFKIVNLITNTTSNKYFGRNSEIVSQCSLIKNYNVGLLTLLTYTKSVKKIVKDENPEYMYMWDFAIVMKLSKIADGYFTSKSNAFNTVASSTLSITGKSEAKNELGCWFVNHYDSLAQSCPSLKRYINYKIVQCNGIFNSKISVNYFSLIIVFIEKIYLKLKNKIIN